MATIEDVARQAGVSRMTVSRVINNSGYIKKETRERILQIIREMNYRPNMAAKTLVTRHNQTIAYVMVNISDPFHNLVSQGLESVSFKRQYTSMMCDTHSPRREQDYINMFRDHCLGGAVFHHLALTLEQVEEMRAGGMQVVLMDNEEDIPGVASVNTDSYGGAKMAVEYLISKGHTRIGCVHGVMERKQGEDVPYEDTFQFNIWRQRTTGFVDAMTENGLDATKRYQSNGRFDIAGPCTKAFLDEMRSDPARPTALYCENDMMAIAVLNGLQERSIRVPDEMAVIGHDGLDICRMLHPYITTIGQPRYEMGRTAANMLIDQIEKKGEVSSVVLSSTLVIGETA
ncbi:MAG: LacI family DNA-binding transcriptional regulator [Clostridia bacterium]